MLEVISVGEGVVDFHTIVFHVGSLLMNKNHHNDELNKEETEDHKVAPENVPNGQLLHSM